MKNFVFRIQEKWAIDLTIPANTQEEAYKHAQDYQSTLYKNSPTASYEHDEIRLLEVKEIDE